MIERMLHFEIDGKRIPAALTTPSDQIPKWSVILIPGSGPSDIDGNYPEGGMWPGRTNVLRDLAHQLADRGAACFRYSRANLETIDGEKSEVFKRFDHRVRVAAEACRVAGQLTPGTSLAVAGHSEGSVIGSMLCNERDSGVDALISLSGPAFRFYDLMLIGAERRAVDGILNFGPAKIPLDLYRRSIDVARNGMSAPDELKALPFGFHTMDSESRQYLQGYDSVDNRELIAKVRCPVLIVQGGADTSGVWPENGELLAAAREASSMPASKAFFSDLDHFYKKEGCSVVDDRVAAAIVDWLSVCRK